MSLNNAIDNFFSGYEPPPYEICEKLVETEMFKTSIIKALNKKARSISFQPYENDMVIVYDPVYIGPYTTSLTYNIDDKTITVYFDCN